MKTDRGFFLTSLAALLSLLLTQTVSAQAPKVPELSKEVMAQLLRQKDKKGKLGALSVMRWAEFAGSVKSKNECEALAELYEELKDTSSRRAILYAAREAKHPKLYQLRKQVIENGKADAEVIGLALIGQGHNAPYEDAAQCVQYFYHDNTVLRQAAVESLGLFINRYEAWESDRFVTGERAYSKFSNFRKYVDERCKDESGEIRAIALKILLNIAVSVEKLGLDRLIQASKDKSSYVRFVFAKIATENSKLKLIHHLIPLLTDQAAVAHSASLAVYKRMSIDLSRAARAPVLEAIATDMKKADSCVKEAPLVLYQLAILEVKQGEFDQAIEYYRLCSAATVNGGVLPIYFRHNIGATSHIRIAEILQDQGKNKAAQTELMNAHYAYKSNEMVQIGAGNYQTLGGALKVIAKALGGPKFFPPVPGRGDKSQGAKPGQGGPKMPRPRVPQGPSSHTPEKSANPTPPKEPKKEPTKQPKETKNP